jgi:hypothetical protein
MFNANNCYLFRDIFAGDLSPQRLGEHAADLLARLVDDGHDHV